MKATAVIAAIILAWTICAAHACGQQLSLAANTSLVRLRPGETSRPLQVTIARSGTVGAADFLTAWQLSLQLAADTGSIGSAAFDKVLEPEVGYAFDDVGSLGVSAINSGIELLAFDTHFPFSGGTQVETGTEASLLQITVRASSDALGSFGLYVVPGLGNSEWSDATQPLFLRREFDNVRDGQAPIRLADILVFHTGDYDFDNDVDGRDFLVWQHGDSPNSLSSGDLQEWRENVGFDANSFASIETVPETSTLVLFILAFSVAMLSRHLATILFNRRRPRCYEPQHLSCVTT